MLIERRELLKRGMRVGEIGGQVGIESRLIVFDGENGFSPQCIHAEHKILLGVQGICGADAPLKWQAGQERLSYRDLIGLLGNGDLQERFLAVMSAEGEQVGSRLLVL